MCARARRADAGRRRTGGTLPATARGGTCEGVDVRAARGEGDDVVALGVAAAHVVADVVLLRRLEVGRCAERVELLEEPAQQHAAAPGPLELGPDPERLDVPAVPRHALRGELPEADDAPAVLAGVERDARDATGLAQPAVQRHGVRPRRVERDDARHLAVERRGEHLPVPQRVGEGEAVDLPHLALAACAHREEVGVPGVLGERGGEHRGRLPPLGRVERPDGVRRVDVVRRSCRYARLVHDVHVCRTRVQVQPERRVGPDARADEWGGGVKIGRARPAARPAGDRLTPSPRERATSSCRACAPRARETPDRRNPCDPHT